MGSIPGLGRSPQEWHGNPLQYCCLENPMDRGAWGVTVHGVAKNWIRLSMRTRAHTHTHTHIHTHTHTPHCGVLWLAFECWGVIQLKLKWDLVSENQGAGSGSTAVFCDLGQVFSQSLNFLICKILLMTIHMLLKGSNVVKVVKAPLKSCKCHFPST